MSRPWPRNQRREAAEKYAASGWPVFPVKGPQGRCSGSDGCSCKRPLTEHGFKDASTDPGQLIEWWERWPVANVGIATGWPGPDVVDVDHHGGEETGYKALARLQRAGLVDNPQAVIHTPSGGAHLYFGAEEGRPQGNGSLHKSHIDFRGTGGYVIAPPSFVHGGRYEVVSHQPVTATVDFSAIRAELEPQAAPRPPQHQRQRDAAHGFDHLPGVVAQLQPGNRNGGLYWAASRAAEGDALDDEMAERLVQAALTAGIRGGEREARATVASARRSVQPQAPRPFARQHEQEREAG